MKNTIRSILSLAFFSLACTSVSADPINLVEFIPTIEVATPGFLKIPDVAQYKGADWSNVIGIAHNVTLAEAVAIANDNPAITYFFYMKGRKMVLENDYGDYRLFHRRDAVFFTGDPWWGSAEGFADGYIKVYANDLTDQDSNVEIVEVVQTETTYQALPVYATEDETPLNDLPFDLQD